MKNRMSWYLVAVLSLTATVLGGGVASAQSASGNRSQAEVAKCVKLIDQEVAKRLTVEKIAASPLADDAEFLRRVFLDLTGQIPTYEKTLAFLDSKDPHRRARLIDELLSSPEFGRHLGTIWANLLLSQETPGKDRELFQKWFAEQLNQGKSWDKIVYEILTPEGEPAKAPATVFFLAQVENNQIQPNMVAGATTRFFLGVQLQCAECHNHPFTGWKQTEFWGMAAFFGQVKNLKDKKSPVTGVTEVSAPVKGKGPAVKGAAIAIPGTAGKGAGKIVKAKFLEGAEPALGDQGPYRPALAQWATSKENKFFARAAVNRFWAHLFGLGMVNPVDDLHDDNPASHPELLAALVDEFKASGFDVKHLLRCICNSQTYQRTSRPVDLKADDKQLFGHMATKVMSPEVLYDALIRALGVKELNITTGKSPTLGIGGAKKAAPTNNREKFIKFFRTQDADSVPTDFTHGIPQALSLMNDPQFTRSSPVVDELAKAGLKQEQGVERLFLGVLSRRPTPAETKAMVAYLAQQKDPVRGYAGVMWILLNTPEFVLIR